MLQFAFIVRQKLEVQPQLLDRRNSSWQQRVLELVLGFQGVSFSGQPHLGLWTAGQQRRKRGLRPHESARTEFDRQELRRQIRHCVRGEVENRSPRN